MLTAALFKIQQRRPGSTLTRNKRGFPALLLKISSWDSPAGGPLKIRATGGVFKNRNT